MGSSEIFYSNRIEVLFEALKRELQAVGGGPFTRRLVVVSSQAMRDWVSFRLASEGHLGILMGVDVCLLPAALERLSGCRFSPVWGLSLHIEALLRGWIDGEMLGSYPGLMKCLGRSQTARARQRRLAELATHLGKLFSLYGIYGGEALESWLESEDWQANLWRTLFEGEDAFSYPAKALAEARLLESPQVHLFAPTFVPRVYQAFLDQVGEKAYCATYVLSPCQAFWTDTLSDRESRRLTQYWRQRGAKQGQLEDLDVFLRERNPLLANFGRLGREYHALLEESDRHIHEQYHLPAGIKGLNAYQELMTEDPVFEGGDLRLLEALQADMTLLRNPRDSDVLEFNAFDDSVQIHRAPTKWREVEILHDNLLRMLEAGIQPHEILVMAPDIMKYQPYVEAIFDRRRSGLPFQIMDIRVDQDSGFFQAFGSLLDLAEGRWDQAKVLELLDSPYVQASLHLDKDELIQLKTWIRELGVRWGFSGEHRHQALVRLGCEKGWVAGGEQATWDQAFRRLLRGMVAQEDLKGDILPAMGLDGSDGDLLGRWICWMRGLFRDLEALRSERGRTVPDWVKSLRELMEAYLRVPPEDGAGSRDRDLLERQLLTLEEEGARLGSSVFPFDSVRHQLEALWGMESKTAHEHNFRSIRFCSLLPMRSIPAKAIFLLGMDEDSFPRREDVRSLNRLHEFPGSDYCPSRVDYDRYLFLEALLSARAYLIVSHVAYDTVDASELGASLVVQELIDYLDETYRIVGQSFSEVGIHQHPFSSFSPDYFLKGGKWTSYNTRAFEAARRLQQEKQDLLDFAVGRPDEASGTTLDLRFLREVARNPLKTYLARGLGMYVKTSEQEPIDEPFTLDALERYQLRMESMELKLDDLIHLAERRSQLPFGLFREVAVEQLRKEVDELQSHLLARDCPPSEYFRLDLSPSARGVNQVGDRHWIVPAVSLQLPSGEEVRVVGTLMEASSRGLPVFTKGGIANAVKAWPSFLAFWAVVQQQSLDWLPRVVFGRDGGELQSWSGCPESLLADFIEHAKECETRLCPLLPEWTEWILKEPSERAIEKMEGTLDGGGFQSLYNDYAEWYFTRRSSLERVPWDFWQERGRELWRPMAQAWFPKLAEAMDGLSV